MSVTDPISDYLTRIRNAAKAKHKKVDIPSTKMKESITKILLENEYIQHYSIHEEGVKKILRIYLKYDETGCVIRGLKRISKPGIRYYVNSKNLPRVLNGLGMAIISTPKGIMTEKQARKQNVGGEVICHIW
ncbi:MAG TPA: 30S ribosomal protein S8 [Bacteroidota bacterium]|jgi:small subunit ribosomal protein S8|nr:30S ribosomal protein S8 [Bacteroidota bacterium]